MTGPNPIHVVPVQGVGGELLDAVKPLIEAWDRKQQLELAQQEFNLRKKQADLAQQEHDEALQRLIKTGSLVQAVTAAQGQNYTGRSVQELIGQAPLDVVGQPAVAEMLGKYGNVVQNTEDYRRKIALDRIVHVAVGNLFSHGTPSSQEFGKVLAAVGAEDPQKAQQLASAFGNYFPDFQYVQNPQGGPGYWVDRKHPGVYAGGIPERQTPTEQQGKDASYAMAEIDATALATKLEMKYHNIAQRVDAKIRPFEALGKITFVGGGYPGHFGVGVGGLGPAVGVLLEPGILKTLTPEEQDYLVARIVFANYRLRKASGATINQEELGRERAPFFPPAGTEDNDDLVKQMQHNRAQEAMSNLASAGNAFNPRLLSPLGRVFYNAYQSALIAPEGQTEMPEANPDEAAAQAITRAGGIPQAPQNPLTPGAPRIPAISGIESPEQALERLKQESAKRKRLTKAQSDSAALGKLFP